MFHTEINKFHAKVNTNVYKLNLKTFEWKMITTKGSPLMYHSLFSYNNNLVIFGGKRPDFMETTASDSY